MNIEITITWYEHNPVGLWFNDRLIWEDNKIITNTNLLETKVSLPLAEAIKFSSIFINGMISNRLLVLFAAVKTECAKLEKLLKTQQKDPDIDCWPCDGNCKLCEHDENTCEGFLDYDKYMEEDEE